MKPPKVNDIVMISSDSPRLQWKLGKIMKLHQGRDGHVRSVELLTAHGIVTRPVVKIFPLEIENNTTN